MLFSRTEPSSLIKKYLNSIFIFEKDRISNVKIFETFQNFKSDQFKQKKVENGLLNTSLLLKLKNVFNNT